MDIKSPVAEARNEYTYNVGGQKLKVAATGVGAPVGGVVAGAGGIVAGVGAAEVVGGAYY